MFEWTTTSVSKQFSPRHPDGIDVSVPNGEIKRVCEAAADYCEKRLPDDEMDAACGFSAIPITRSPLKPITDSPAKPISVLR